MPTTAPLALGPPLARLRDTCLGLASMGGAPAPAPAVVPTRTLVFGTTFRTCAVCLDEYKIGDTLRVLECGHCFHAKCVDAWVARSSSCPVCKSNVLPPPKQVPRQRTQQLQQHSEETQTQPRVQLIDLSVHDSWLDWLARIINRRIAPQDHPPLSLAVQLS